MIKIKKQLLVAFASMAAMMLTGCSAIMTEVMDSGVYMETTESSDDSTYEEMTEIPEDCVYEQDVECVVTSKKDNTAVPNGENSTGAIDSNISLMRVGGRTSSHRSSSSSHSSSSSKSSSSSSKSSSSSSKSSSSSSNGGSSSSKSSSSSSKNSSNSSSGSKNYSSTRPKGSTDKFFSRNFYYARPRHYRYYYPAANHYADKTEEEFDYDENYEVTVTYKEENISYTFFSKGMYEGYEVGDSVTMQYYRNDADSTKSILVPIEE